MSVTPSGVQVGIDDGRSVAGDVAVLATGHDEAAREGPACYISPWETPADAGVRRDAAILIRGTGLTMVDYVVSLRANGHQGPIYAMSRRGLLPQAHRPVSALKLDAADIPFGAGMVELWRWFRALAEDTMARGGDWRSAVDGIRPFPRGKSRRSSVVRGQGTLSPGMLRSGGRCTGTAWHPRSS